MKVINNMTVKTILNKYLNINNIFNFHIFKIVSENDRIFVDRTNAALDRCDRGLGVTMTEEEFLEELETW